jgi:hypothetical protein
MNMNVLGASDFVCSIVINNAYNSTLSIFG